MGVLPNNYEVPKSGSSDLFIKLEPGETKIRILDEPTLGYIYWKDKKPTRVKQPGDVPSGEDAKHFWFVPVWCNDKVSFLEISQKTVLSELAFLDSSDDWGGLDKHDVTIKRTGEGMETQYFVQPVPPKALSKKAKDTWQEMKKDYKPNNLFVEGGSVYAKSDDDEELPF